jgi:DNA-binding NarL/FixJ family response regulator
MVGLLLMMKNKNMAHVLTSPSRTPETYAAAPATGGQIAVAVVEDNPGLRRSLTRLINLEPRMRCVGAWPEGKSALIEMPALKPDVVLMDINMPGMSGIECTARFKQICPHTQVIMVTVYEDSESVFSALQAGACGYLLKRSAPERIVEAIREARDGGSPMTSQIARKVVDVFKRTAAPSAAGIELTPREKEVLELFAKGFVNKEIADKLNISYQTVKGYTKTIYEKLHVHSRSEALMKFVSNKGLTIDVPRKPFGG